MSSITCCQQVVSDGRVSDDDIVGQLIFLLLVKCTEESPYHGVCHMLSTLSGSVYFLDRFAQCTRCQAQSDRLRIWVLALGIWQEVPSVFLCPAAKEAFHRVVEQICDSGS